MADEKSNLTQAAALQLSSLNKKKSVEEDSKEFNERNPDLEWQDSSNAKNCQKCQRKFSITTRKHHCRYILVLEPSMHLKAT